MEFTDIIRTGHIARWNLVRTHRDQTIAEHMYQVAMIAFELAGKLEPFPHNKAPYFNAQTILLYALWHDVEEIKSGDVPTPTKQFLSKHFDADVGEVLDGMFWKPGVKEYEYIHEIGNDHIAIIKIADLMEAIFFLETEGVGTFAIRVKELLISRLGQMIASLNIKYPNIPWQRAMDNTQLTLEKLKSGEYY